MKNYWCLILLVFCVSSCYKELPNLERNLLHDDTIPLFEIDSVTVLHDLPELKIRVFYKAKILELTEAQREKLPFIRIFKDDEQIKVEGIQKIDENSDQLLSFDDTVEQGLICYTFFFSGSASSNFIDSKTREIKLCVEI